MKKEIRNKNLARCARCGSEPVILEGWDTLQVKCKCGDTGKEYFGDYADEAFMYVEYGERAILEWNSRQTNRMSGRGGIVYGKKAGKE